MASLPLPFLEGVGSLADLSRSIIHSDTQRLYRSHNRQSEVHTLI